MRRQRRRRRRTAQASLPGNSINAAERKSESVEPLLDLKCFFFPIRRERERGLVDTGADELTYSWTAVSFVTGNEVGAGDAGAHPCSPLQELTCSPRGV